MKVRDGGFRLLRRAGAGTVEGRAMLRSVGFPQEPWGDTEGFSAGERQEQICVSHGSQAAVSDVHVRGASWRLETGHDFREMIMAWMQLTAVRGKGHLIFVRSRQVIRCDNSQHAGLGNWRLAVPFAGERARLVWDKI